MQAPLPPPAAPAASPYQPPAGAMGKANMYSFSKWLMIGLSLLVIASAFGQLPLASSAPDVSDYDLTDDKEAEQYDDDVDSYATQISVFGALASILQTGSLTLLAYAFVREAQEETGQHVAMRITLILGAVVLITSIVGRSFSLF
ncbi:MAG: hypothetical protein ACO20Y_02785 [Poseidonia sp.]